MIALVGIGLVFALLIVAAIRLVRRRPPRSLAVQSERLAKRHIRSRQRQQLRRILASRGASVAILLALPLGCLLFAHCATLAGGHYEYLPFEPARCAGAFARAAAAQAPCDRARASINVPACVAGAFAAAAALADCIPPAVWVPDPSPRADM